MRWWNWTLVVGGVALVLLSFACVVWYQRGVEFSLAILLGGLTATVGTLLTSRNEGRMRLPVWLPYLAYLVVFATLVVVLPLMAGWVIWQLSQVGDLGHIVYGGVLMLFAYCYLVAGGLREMRNILFPRQTRGKE